MRNGFVMDLKWENKSDFSDSYLNFKIKSGLSSLNPPQYRWRLKTYFTNTISSRGRHATLNAALESETPAGGDMLP
ncbi:hypothetical protein LEMLEM_LOCUS4284 [Lemmus lemmus]